MSSDLIKAGVMDSAINIIRSQVAALDDSIPFLLMPVRLETRFMEVDHPLFEVTAPEVTAVTVIKDLGILQDKLAAFTRQPLDTVEKPKKKETYVQLDKLMDEITGQCTLLESYYRDTLEAAPAQIAKIQEQWKGIQRAAKAVPDQIARLKSNYLREQYQSTFAQVQEKSLNRVMDLFVTVTIPKMSYFAAFNKTGVAEYRESVHPILKDLKAPVSVEIIRQPGFHRKLDESIEKLKMNVGALVIGSHKELEEINRTWQEADHDLNQIVQVVNRDTKLASESGRTRGNKLTNITRFKPRNFSNKDLTYSIQTQQMIQTDLKTLGNEMKKASLISEKDGLEVVNQLLAKIIDKTAARLNCPVLLPASYKAELLARVAKLGFKDFIQRLEKTDKEQKVVFQKYSDQYVVLIGSIQTEVDLDRGAPLVIPTKTVDELWVRIYPDDFFVHTHETELTSEEIEAGKAYWREQWLTGGNRELAESAWRLLCSKYTVQRAAWIVRQLKPKIKDRNVTGKAGPEKLNAILKSLAELLKQLPPLSRLDYGLKREEVAHDVIKQLQKAQKELAEQKRGGKGMLAKLQAHWVKLQHLLQEFMDSASQKSTSDKHEAAPWADELRKRVQQFEHVLASVKEIDAKFPERDFKSLLFPEVPMKKEAWIHPPQTYAMPDRFVVLTMVGESFTNVIAGKTILDPLILGLDPRKFNLDNTFSYDAEGNLIVDPTIKWLTDFTEAVNCGMGIVIPLAPGEKLKKIDKVLVLGVNSRQTSSAQQNKLETLLENHHYKSDGMEFIPAGTPTNNTDQRIAGFMSRDDKDAAWKVECGGNLFNAAETDPAKISDGKRLAVALGIKPDIFQHIGNSDLNEISQAMTLNRVLTPATLGYFLEEIVSPLIPLDASNRIRDYFNNNVIGRGILPSLRVGTQPYGMLVTSAFSRFRMLPDENSVVITDADKANSALLEAKTQQQFEIRLRKFLWMLHEDWTRVILPEVKYAGNTDAANPQAHFMNMLGLEAHSLVNYFRYSVNSASRLAYTATEPANVNFDPAAYYSPSAFLARIAEVLNLSDKDKIELQSTVLRLPLYRMRYMKDHGDLKGDKVVAALSEKDTLPEVNFIQWLSTKNPYEIWNQNKVPGVPPNSLPSTSLLFLLLRHAWLLNYRDAALNILELEKLITEDIRGKAGSPEFYHTYSPVKNHNTFITKWNYLFTGLNQLDGLFDSYFDTNSVFYQHLQPRASLAEYLRDLTPSTIFQQHKPFMDKLTAARADFAALQAVPTAKLDRLLAEHLDTCSYRLDAWQLGLVNQRLNRQRAKNAQGIYLGAFGWVENLCADSERPLAKTIPTGLGKPSDGPVYYDIDNEGFVHAPSINHAMTAAILRSGYIANKKTGDLQNPLAVNLTSERVRMALRIMEGVRQGVDVGALLGYQFERGLHERYADNVNIELDQYVYPFRRNFPGTPAVDTTLENNQEPRQVVNGLAVLKTVRDVLTARGTTAPGATLIEALNANLELYPFELWDNKSPLTIKPSLLPPIAKSDELQAVLKEIDRMADAFDAMSDLLMAESVYQVAQGNHTRAAAVVAALAEGKNAPQPEIINTPRTGSLITQRVILNVPPISGRSLSPQSVMTDVQRSQNLDLARAPYWENSPFSPRALAEPSLNRWLGTVLGDPDQIRCWVEYKANDASASLAVSLQDLRLQPLDAVLLLGSSAAVENASELNARIAYYVRQTLQLGLNTELTVNAKERSDKMLKTPTETLTPDIKSFYEIAPLLRGLADFIDNSRPGAADDLILPENNNFTDRTGQDVDELKLRLSDLNNTVKDLILSWLNFYAQTPTPSSPSYDLSKLKIDDYIYGDEKITQDGAYLITELSNLRKFLFSGAGLGIPFAVPQSVIEDTPEQVKALVKQGNDVFRALMDRWRRAQPLLAKNTVTGCLDAAKELAGKNCVIIPLFKANNPDELKTATTQSPALLVKAAQGSAFPMDAWLQGLAKSRKRMNTLETLKLLSSLLNQPFPELSPSQLPTGGDYWVGLTFPDDFKPARHTLSLVHLNLPVDWTQTLCGLVADEWTEKLPNADELTGITYNYNQPDSTAPQSLLLAVTPVETGHWAWDDLVYTLIDTLELAKLRAVEPEHVDKTLFSQWLPTVMGEVVPADMQDNTIANPLGVQVVVDFAANNPTQ